MEQYQLRALENAFKHDRFKGLFGFSHYGGARDNDRERAMSLEDPEKNPYVSMFAAMSAMTVSMEAMMQDVEGRIKACPTGQLFSLVMNRYNPAWSLANVIPGYIIRDYKYVDEVEGYVRGRICHAAISELKRRMVNQANHLTEWDIMGRMLLDVPELPREIRFPGEGAAQILGRLRMAYAWDVVVNKRPAAAPVRQGVTVYNMGLDLIDVMPELEDALKAAYPGLAKRDKPGRAHWFTARSSNFMTALSVVLFGTGYKGPVTEPVILKALAERCRGAHTIDFGAEYGTFEADALKESPFSSIEFLKRVYESLDTSRLSSWDNEAVAAAVNDAVDYMRAKMPPAPEPEDMSVASADFLADGVDAASARQDAVMKCPSCGETMFIGGMCSCGYEDDTVPDGDL